MVKGSVLSVLDLVEGVGEVELGGQSVQQIHAVTTATVQVFFTWKRELNLCATSAINFQRIRIFDKLFFKVLKKGAGGGDGEVRKGQKERHRLK